MRFRSGAFGQLARQLGFAPAKRRRAQLDRAEALYWEIEPGRDYPLDFVVYRITRYRPDTFKLMTIPGKTLRHDLLVLVEQISASLDEPLDAYQPRPLTLQQVQRRLQVTSKTIQRYRRQGLFARWMVDSGSRRRKRLAFLPASVERFLAERDAAATRRAGRFSRIDEPTRHAILTRARRLVARRPDLTPYQAARHLGPRLARSTEAVRQVLVRHDRRDPRVAIFPRHVPPLNDRQEQVIHRAFHRGVSVSRLATRFGKSRYTIYRAIHRRRAAAIHQLPLDYVVSPTFELPDAEQIILDSALPGEGETPRPPRTPDARPPENARASAIGQLYGDEPHDADLERALFVRYNYLKYRAAKLRDQLDAYEPRSGELDRIETWLRRAVAVKVRLVRANLRLVVSVARKHLAGRSERGGPTLAALVDEGNAVLLETIETYDAARGNRFGSYLAWTLMRRFASDAGRVDPAEHVARPTLDRAAGAYWPLALNPARAAWIDSQQMAHELGRLLEPLSERERFIVTRHFGVSDATHGLHDLAPQPLATLAESLGLSVERVRQIERRAVTTIRRTAAELHLAQPLIADAGPGSGGATVVPSAGKGANDGD